MKLLHTKDIAIIDAAAAHNGFPVSLLMKRAGEATARAVADLAPTPGKVLLFCGGGNNGGDGYAAAVCLREGGYSAIAVDVFAKGQKTAEGKEHLAAYIALAGEPLSLPKMTEESLREEAAGAVCLVDAVFGTGFSGELPAEALQVARLFRESTCKKLAVDIPLGVDGENGTVSAEAITVDHTVCLSFYKRGLFSYPAKECCGTLSLATLGIPREAPWLPSTDTFATTAAFAAPFFPPRRANTHKGTYGRALLVCGSARHRGAACLASEGALRTGAGLVTLAAEEAVLQTAIRRLPELIALPIPPAEKRETDAPILSAAEGADAILVGCGCGRSAAIHRLLCALLEKEGAPLIIDADGLNVLAEKDGLHRLAQARRPVILTPHPLELARLLGCSAEEVQANRLAKAKEAMKKTGAVVVLKGAATIIAAQGETYINQSGSPALAKGGSGDALAGIILALCAGGIPPAKAAALGAYLHGAAGDLLEKDLSDRGVLPHEIPRAAARVICLLQKGEV